MAHGDMSFFARPSSAAVKISAPPSDEPPSPKPSKKGLSAFPASLSTSHLSSQTHRNANVGIYSFMDKGCIYYHPPRDEPSAAPPDSPTPAAALPAQAVNAPVFVPKGHPGSPSLSAAAPASIQQQTSVSSDSSSEPSYSSAPSEQLQTHEQELQVDPDQYDPYNPYLYADHTGQTSDVDGQAPVTNPYDLPPDQLLGYDAAALDPFYTPSVPFTRQPLIYHLYTLPRPEALAHNYFISDDIREELQRRSETIHTTAPQGLGLPEELQGYHSLVPLESVGSDRRKFGNWYSIVYRATSSNDGLTYILRRIENFRLMQQTAFGPIEAWQRIQHPNIVSVREAFTTRAFNDSSLVVVYDDHPNSQTLYEVHIKPKAPQFLNGRLQAASNRIPERTLWSYIVQIANAIKAVHDAGLAVRLIDPTKILVTGKNRVRIGSCGIVDVLMHDVRTDVAYLQQDDLTMFGALIFMLCCQNLSAMNNLQKAIDHLGRNYSADLKSVALFLISKAGPTSRLLTELDESQNAADRLESELTSELENGRLVRLLCKFNFINERPEHNHEARWSETGDRYIVKLFRDYVFHQVDEMGKPVVNLTHVLSCLNKLDAGTEERIMLVSRDEQSCLVVSYREVKACIDSAFGELTRG
ncbi:kinase-like domain-containing protein [Fomes fomentarius]|nr:kinase-like domain-containing protein [Fomes fomentarius]